MSGVVPAKIAAHFTQGELAILTVIGRQVQRCQVCVLPVDAIAALAGVCRRLAQTAMREAERLGLLLVKERRIPGRKSMTNLVSIVSPEWKNWLRPGGRTTGCKKMHATDNPFSSLGVRDEKRPPEHHLARLQSGLRQPTAVRQSIKGVSMCVQ
jgi:hypothetical protein